LENVQIGVELRALSNAIRRYFESSSHHAEISRATGNNKWIIHFLIKNEGRDVYQKDIESHFGIARSTASKVLNLMEQKGLIIREAVEHDGRLKKIVPTDEAKKLAKHMKEDAKKMSDRLTYGFSEKELSELNSYLRRMRENIGG
jgi:DNA-binding MarR family transcriptional regulator